MTRINTIIAIIIFCFCLISCSSNTDVKKKTSSGYEYVHHTMNETGTPNVGDYVFYEMQILGDSGEVIQNMRDLPNMPAIQILDPSVEYYRLNPLNEMLSNMSVGDSATLTQPIDSLPTIPSQFQGLDNVYYSVIVRDMKTRDEYMAYVKEQTDIQRQKIEELRGMEGSKIAEAKAVFERFMAGEFDDQKQTAENGVEYVIHQEGEGELPKFNSYIYTHYVGFLEDGTSFDNSYRSGKAYTFPLGRKSVIEGWDIAFANFKAGTVASVYVPFEMAYGVAGREGFIPESADLYFYVEFESFYNYN